MIPINTTPEQEATFAAKAHVKALAAMLAIQPPKGIRLRQNGEIYSFNLMGNRWVSGLILMVIAVGLAYLQYHTWNFVFENSEPYHKVLWILLGISLVMGIPFLFQRQRIRIYNDRMVYSKPILGLGLPNTIFWSEVKAMSKGAAVGMQDQIPMPGGRGGASLGHQGVASIIRIKSIGGDLSFGAHLSSPKRAYLLAALIAYYKAWRAAMVEELSLHQAAQKP
jgi:hypothetical protein